MSESSSQSTGIPSEGVTDVTAGDKQVGVTEDCKPESNNSSDRQRVLKEVGLTSTAFIGPAFPPQSTTVQPDLEDTLSEFYKELKKIDTPAVANESPEKQNEGSVQPLKPSAIKEAQDVREEKSEDLSGWRQQSWPHWYQNEPYRPRRPQQDIRRAAPSPQNPWHGPQIQGRPPNPGFLRPPFHRPPPPLTFPNPQNPPAPGNWTTPVPMNQHQEASRFPPVSGPPPPNMWSQPPSQGFYRDKDDRFGFSVDCEAKHDGVNVAPYRDDEEWQQLDEDYDRHQRYDSENESWEHRHHHPTENRSAPPFSPVLILMRGLPGSGKSTLARELLSTGPSGLILSTDDFFTERGGYRYDAGLLGAAHDWNQSRARDAMHDGRSPIIIDNTNIQAWEMKPYVQMALERGYRVDFCEPDTSWKYDPYELEKRNKHGVRQEKIAQMMDHFSFPISVDIVMSSQEPLHVNQRRRPQRPHRGQDFY